MAETACQVVTTVDAEGVARELARGAVAARLAACAQLAGPMISVYWWHDAVTSATEWQIVFKTTAESYPALAAFLRAHHPYDVPEILCLPISGGDATYLAWLAEQVRDTPAGPE